MIAALKNQRFYDDIKLREYGVPAYIIEQSTDSELVRMIDTIPINPWIFYNKDIGFSIKLCEKLADKFCVNKGTDKAKAYVEYALDRVAMQGHCYAKEYQISQTLKESKCSSYELQSAITFMQKLGNLFISKKGNYFLSKYFNAEKAFANMFRDLVDQDGLNNFCYYKTYSPLYDQLNDKQKQVVDAIENHRIIILTGLPGTGKTTTVRAIVDSFGQDNIMLFAPTGKASSRLKELCGMDASTLHSYFHPLQSQIITNKIIVIDELSMCDVEIAGEIPKFIGENCTLLLVGDPDQLPSVGPGQILKDILASKLGARYHLDQIMRQKPGSIIKSAHSIHNGNGIVCDEDKEVNVLYPENFNIEYIAEKILNNKNWRDAQFLAVLKEKGSKIINDVAQRILNPGTDKGFRVGDKVIHTINNKDLNVFNGEMGIVTHKTDRFLTVEFKDRKINYPICFMYQLELSYCITVHKSQGSEFDKVVLFVNKSQITNRNLIYTALTRAKSKILIIAESKDSLLESIANKQNPRQTSLKYLLTKEN